MTTQDAPSNRVLIELTVFYASLSIIMTAVNLYLTKTTVVAAGICLLLGVLAWSLIEYLFHRFVLHLRIWPKFIERWHGHKTHHGHPHLADEIAYPVSHSIPLALVYFLLIWVLFRFELNYALWTFVGSSAGYLYYEWVHWCTHFKTAKTAIGSWQHQNHEYHHHQTPHKRFGVTSPLWDWVFRTQ